MSQIEDQDSSLAKMKKANAELEQQNIECRRNLELMIDNMDLQKAKVVTEILSWMDKSPSLELHRPSCMESGQDCPGQSPCEREQNVLDTDSGLTLKERRIIDRPIDSILGRPSMSLYQTYIYANTLKPKHRLIGEISFQLERRILDYVFGKKQGLGRTGDTSRRRFYGYTLRNIVAKIEEEVRSESEGIDSIAEASMKHSLRYIKRILCPLDYDIDFHGDFAEKMVNHYGLLNTSPEKSTIENFGLEDPRVLRVLLAKLIADETVLKHMLILLDSLCLLAHHDKRPLFLW